MDGENHSAVVLDRHPLWMEAVERVLERAQINVVGKAARPFLAFDLIERHRPDLLVAGIEMDDPETDSGGFLREVRERFPQLRVVVLSMQSDTSTIEEALDAGAAAYVFKSAHPDDLASAVRQTFEHSIYLSTFRATRAQAPPAPGDVSELTRREREILQLVAEGYSNATLAKMLWITEQTVKFHLSNIYRKLNVSNRTGAARWAQLHGLLSDPQHDLVA